VREFGWYLNPYKIGEQSFLQNDKISPCNTASSQTTEAFSFVISSESEKSRALKQEISPVGRNDTTPKRSFCKRLNRLPFFGFVSGPPKIAAIFCPSSIPYKFSPFTAILWFEPSFGCYSEESNLIISVASGVS